uniref:Retrovirus-related Pol polyprotein from transposon TNT 1-94 n=1 Tax=Cajanus cajan TaxID=3821 RepID=A0A151R2R8_CAJCA|nr:hypothetical protein KK1_041949 [Cajanus cajan]
MSSSQHLHFVVVRRTIRYLIGSPIRGLFFPRDSPLQLLAYSDADWAGCMDTRRSTTGYVCFSAMPSFLGNVRSRIMFINLLLRLYIVQCLLLALKLCGYVVFWRSLDFHSLTLPLFMLLIQVLFKLLQIPCSMNVPNIFWLIVTISTKP